MKSEADIAQHRESQVIVSGRIESDDLRTYIFILSWNSYGVIGSDQMLTSFPVYDHHVADTTGKCVSQLCKAPGLDQLR